MEISLILEPSVVLRLFLAVVLGGIVGMEREVHARPAGFRTHVVVCLGATMLVMGSQIHEALNPNAVMDVNRMAAGIITGIGFLGAGAILREENVVRGLTTAGCVWFVAGLGIVIGKGDYALAVWSTLLVFVMLTLFRYVETWVSVERYRNITVRVGSGYFEKVQRRIQRVFNIRKVILQENRFRFDNVENEVEISYRLKIRKDWDVESFLIKLSRLEGVIEVKG